MTVPVIEHLVVRASGHFLSEHLPDDYQELSEEELHQFISDNAWEPLENTEPSHIMDCIDVLALDFQKLLKECNQ
jgi:hypothetical protein